VLKIVDELEEVASYNLVCRSGCNEVLIVKYNNRTCWHDSGANKSIVDKYLRQIEKDMRMIKQTLLHEC
jgi:hypothetical protein